MRLCMCVYAFVYVCVCTVCVTSDDQHCDVLSLATNYYGHVILVDPNVKCFNFACTSHLTDNYNWLLPYKHTRCLYRNYVVALIQVKW